MEMANGSEATPAAAVGAKPGARKRVGMTPKPVKRQNEMSSIGFPYMSLDAGISVARAMLDAGGVPLSREQLAGVMGSSSGSGTFLTKIATARTFGLINYVQGKYELTNLGFSIVDSDARRQRAALAQSFQTVPLYRRVYEGFKGKQLPPRPHGLEQAFVKFGIAPKQANYARLAFDKSAKQVAAGTDRLIEPILLGQTGPTEPIRPTGLSPEVSGAIGTAAGCAIAAGVGSTTEIESNFDPLIRGLLSRLPKVGEKWEIEKRAKWLQTFAANLDIVYPSDDGDKIIIIECKPAKT